MKYLYNIALGLSTTLAAIFGAQPHMTLCAYIYLLSCEDPFWGMVERGIDTVWAGTTEFHSYDAHCYKAYRRWLRGAAWTGL